MWRFFFFWLRGLKIACEGLIRAFPLWHLIACEIATLRLSLSLYDITDASLRHYRGGSSGFERRACVGGLWNYEPQPGPCHIHQPIPAKLCEVGYATSSEDPQKVIAPSAMYEGLRTNVPSVCTTCTHFSLSWHSVVYLFHPILTCSHHALMYIITSSTLQARKACLT